MVSTANIFSYGLTTYLLVEFIYNKNAAVTEILNSGEIVISYLKCFQNDSWFVLNMH